MAIQAARFIMLDNIADGDEIEVEASEDAENIRFRKGDLMFNLTANEFSELVFALVWVQNYVDRIQLRRRKRRAN